MLSTAGVSSSADATEWHAAKYFLTYSQCPAEKEDLRDFLVGLCGEPALLWIVARETHKDDAFHLHAYLEFPKPKRVRDPRYFDFTVGDKVYHPNIGTVRLRARCQIYTAKKGDYITNFEIATVKLTYGEVIARSSTRDEFIGLLTEGYARDVVLNLQRIEYFLDKRFGSDAPPAYVSEFTGFVVPDELQKWYEDNVENAENGT